MYNAERPEPSELPSTGKLLRSTAIAAVVATTLLTLVVLPAEYGVDPTGVGRLLGLTQMGEVKVALAKEAHADEALIKPGPDTAAALVPGPEAVTTAPGIAPPATIVSPAIPQAAPVVAAALPPAVTPASRRDQMTVTLAPDEGTEVKLDMRAGAKARFVWTTSGPKVNFDMHGEGPGQDYRSYGKGTDSRGEGVLTAAFDGVHGWFWRNRSGEPLTVTVSAEGDYAAMKHMD